MLTKSDLQSFLQCPRKLWLERHRPELIPSEDSSLHRRAVDGQIVGEHARTQVGPDFLWPPAASDRNDAMAQAKALLAASPGKAGVEVPMVHDDVYARADALLPSGQGYVLRETKASTFPLKKDKVTPDSPEDHHLDDVAIQAWVMKGAGIEVARTELNLLNNQWRYPGNGDYDGLFRQLDVTADIQERVANVPQWAAAANAVIAGAMPDAQTGKHCAKPYSCCFAGHCEEHQPAGPEHPLELLPDAAGKALAKKLREGKGYTSLLEPAPEELTGAQAALYRRIQKAHITGTAVVEPGCPALFAELPFPRYYFDFEGIDLPVPRWKGYRPYEHAPFQWSCHIELEPGRFEHAEFLDVSGNDPSLPCIERMLQVVDLHDGGPIIVYYKTYEEGRLKDLQLRHPEYREVLKVYIDRLWDLHPVVKQHFYHPAMNGSFSIKAVLPVVAPELNYGELEEVQEGTAAQVAYLHAALEPSTTADRKADLELKMRAYCRQDTWAMVEVAAFLAGAGRPRRPD